MRPATERPVTVEVGTNKILGHDTERLELEIVSALEGRGKMGRIPDLWDGKAAVRIAEALA